MISISNKERKTQQRNVAVMFQGKCPVEIDQRCACKRRCTDAMSLDGSTYWCTVVGEQLEPSSSQGKLSMVNLSGVAQIAVSSIPKTFEPNLILKYPISPAYSMQEKKTPW